MTFVRVLAATLLAACTLVAGGASADTYPSRPITMIVGFPPGTSSDICARLIGQWLSEKLGQQFVIENRPGAGTNIAAETEDVLRHMVKTLLADGYQGVLLILDEVSLFMKSRQQEQRGDEPVVGVEVVAEVVVSRDLAAEDRIVFPHPPLDEGPDEVTEERAIDMVEVYRASRPPGGDRPAIASVTDLQSPTLPRRCAGIVERPEAMIFAMSASRSSFRGQFSSPRSKHRRQPRHVPI